MKKMIQNLRNMKLSMPSRSVVIGVSMLVLCVASVSMFSLDLKARNTIQLDGQGDTYDLTDRDIHLDQTNPPDTTPPPQLTTVSTYVNGDGVVSSYTQNIQLNTTFWYAWNRWLTTSFPSKDDQVQGWVPAIFDPNLTIGYDIKVLDADTSAVLTPGTDSVAQGQRIKLVFGAYTSNNIFWFATGGSLDSPYGDWVANATAPARVGGRVTCEDKDYVSQYTYVDGTKWDIYVPFMVNPPARSVANTTGLDCSALTTSLLGEVSATCTVTASSGSISPTFHFDSTYGKFYYRYVDPRDMGAYGGPGCYGNNIPLSVQPGPNEDSITEVSGGLYPATPVNIAAMDFPLAFSVAPTTNHTPHSPTLTCPSTSVVTGADVSLTLSATDEDGDQVKYGVDWIDDATKEVNSGWTTLADSGTAKTITKTGGYATAGTYTIWGRAADTHGALSEWASCQVTVTAGNQADLTPVSFGPNAFKAGQPIDFKAKLHNGGTVATPTFSSTAYICAESDTTCQNNLVTKAPRTLWEKIVAFINPGALAATVDTLTLTGPAIAAGADGEQTGTKTFATAGNYKVKLCADKPGNQVTESDETNNCGNWELKVACASGMKPNPDGSASCVPGGSDTLTCSPATSNPTTLPATINFTTTYTGSAPSSYTWDDGLGGSYGSASTASRTFPASTAQGTYNMVVSASGKGSATCAVTIGTGAACTPTATPTITATPNRVQEGGKTVITWTNTNADSCTITGTDGYSLIDNPASTCSVSGNSGERIISKQTTYTIDCNGVKKSVTVNLVPKIIEF